MTMVASVPFQRWLRFARNGSRSSATTAPLPGTEVDRLMLVSEQRRMAILAPLLTGLTLLVIGFGCVAHSRGVLPPGYGPMLLVGSMACAYEWLASQYLASAIKRGLRLARFRFYMNALVELSVPTALILLAASYTNPVNAITGPASYVYFLFITLSALRLDFGLCLFTGVIASLAYGFAVMVHWAALQAALTEPAITLAFSFFVRALIFCLGGFVAGLVSVRIRRSLVDTMQTMHERERVVTLFGQHVSPAVVDRLLAQSQSSVPELRPVCILVLDIRNFTGFAENRPPAEVVALLNLLWDFMIRAINEHHGFINKFLGDGFLAVFGAPFPSGNDCQNAMDAARRILREFDAHQASGDFPPIQVGMAVHAGEAIVGSIGSLERREYTVIGDVVNVAFRLEALNKEFGSRLLVSEAVHRHIKEDAGQTTTLQIRGRHETVKTYQMA